MKIINEQNAFPTLLLICICLLYLQTIHLNKEKERSLSIEELKVPSFRNIKRLGVLHLYQNTNETLYKKRNTSITNLPTRRLPNAIILGVKKCGTRALLEYLRLNPDIKAAGPEPHFFDRYYHLGLEWYRQKMPKSQEGQLTIEKTPRYFITKEVPERIYNMSNSIKLILIVRNPTTRAISDFTQSISKGEFNSTTTFRSKAIRRNGTVNMKWSAVNIGLYSHYLKGWLHVFPMKSIHIVNGEKLITNPMEELNAVQDFLQVKRQIPEGAIYMNISRGFPCIKKEMNSPSFKCFRNSKGRQHSFADAKTLTKLQYFYKPYNEEFFKMINKHFIW